MSGVTLHTPFHCLYKNINDFVLTLTWIGHKAISGHPITGELWIFKLVSCSKPLRGPGVGEGSIKWIAWNAAIVNVIFHKTWTTDTIRAILGWQILSFQGCQNSRRPNLPNVHWVALIVGNCLILWQSRICIHKYDYSAVCIPSLLLLS